METLLGEPLLTAIVTIFISLAVIFPFLMTLGEMLPHSVQNPSMVFLAIGLMLASPVTGWRAVNCVLESQASKTAKKEWRQSAPIQAALWDEMELRRNRCAVCGGFAVKSLVEVTVGRDAKEEEIQKEARRFGTPIAKACEHHTEWLSFFPVGVGSAAEYFRSHYEGATPKEQLLSITDDDLFGIVNGVSPFLTANSERELMNVAGMWAGLSVFALAMGLILLVFIRRQKE